MVGGDFFVEDADFDNFPVAGWAAHDVVDAMSRFVGREREVFANVRVGRLLAGDLPFFGELFDGGVSGVALKSPAMIAGSAGCFSTRSLIVWAEFIRSSSLGR